MEGLTWQALHISNAILVSMKSKDPRTKVGAVIVDKHNHPVSTGFNGLPRGVTDTEERLNDRDLKKYFIEHAERNAIFAANESLDGCTLYITHPPCSDCARAIIQSGIKSVVTLKATANLDSMQHYAEQFKYSLKMLSEAGVEYSEIEDYTTPELKIITGGETIQLSKI